MKKTHEERREKALQRIAELIKQRDEINDELNQLTGVANNVSNRTQSEEPPFGFSISKEVFGLFDEYPRLQIRQAADLLQKKYPNYNNVTRGNVQGALVYLANKGKIRRVPEERGLFMKTDDASTPSSWGLSRVTDALRW